MALDCVEARRKGLKGFAFECEMVGVGGSGPVWLRSQKVFKSVEPDPKNAHDPNDPTKPKKFYTNEFPVQSFLWGDYGALPDTVYRLRILPMYGDPGALTTDPKDEIKFEIRTEKEWEDGQTHGVWFNQGAIASQLSPSTSTTRHQRTSTIRKTPRSYGSHAASSKRASVILTRLLQTTHYVSPPMSSPTRVADIYMTEFDRIFRHFYFRDIANEPAGSPTSDDAKAIFLDETDGWTDSYFEPGHVKTNRRVMFFAPSATTWSANAAAAKTVKPTKPIAKKSKGAKATSAPTSKKKAKKTAKAKKKTPKKLAKKKTTRTAGKKSKAKRPR